MSGAVDGDVTAGVTVDLTGEASVVTSDDGTFAFTDIADGDYTLTPTLAGYSFVPSSIAVSVDGADVSGQRFTATAISGSTFSIRGSLTGTLVAGVRVELSGCDNGDGLMQEVVGLALTVDKRRRRQLLGDAHEIGDLGDLDQ